MTRIKICGIQDLASALVAADAGAEFIGLVFVPERRRRLDTEEALRIASGLRARAENLPAGAGQASPQVVGLFADQPAKDVLRTVELCELHMVQLCGGESLDYCGRLGVPVIKVVHVPGSPPVDETVASLSREMASLRDEGHLITLDRKVEGMQGGTGQSFNWDIARRLSEKKFPFLLAGGLTPDNVGAAVGKVRPWGVDVSSGVETSGLKDPEKIRAFIQAVREAARATTQPGQ